MSYYYQANQGVLKSILGSLGITIDAVCTDEKSRLLVRQLWKLNMAVRKKEIEADKKKDEKFLKSWHESLSQTMHYRRFLPNGKMVLIRNKYKKFMNWMFR